MKTDSSKIVGLILNSRFGILEAQECHFETTPDHLIQLKAGVGDGKTSVGNALNAGMSGGSERELPFDLKAYENMDVEEQILYGDVPIWMRTTYKDGKLNSVLYIKDEDGKKVSNPVIDGKKMTPATLRDKIRTELTFGVDEFISENPKVQMEWMMKVYKDKLKEKGIVFDKKDEKYYGSLLYQLDQAKMDRSSKYERVRTLNAFRVALEGEGLREENIPDFIDPEIILKEKKEAEQKYYAALRAVEEKISDVKIEAQKSVSVIDAYNRSLSDRKSVTDEKNRLSVDSFNRDVDALTEKRKKIYEYIQYLSENGAPMTLIVEWYSSLDKIPEKKVFKECEIHAVPKNEHGNYVHDMKYDADVEESFSQIEKLRDKIVSLMAEKEAIKMPDDIYMEKIEKAKVSNSIAARWAAFFDHQRADEEVKRIFNEYKKMFTSIDLGVDGLKISIIGDENSMELRTVYNGVHNPVLFHNDKKEYRPISSYSYTQRNVIAILEQLYLLEEKKKAGDKALRFLFIESPMDSKTKDLLLSYQKKYDLQLMCTVTADVDENDIKDGEIIIKNGYLISKKNENK